MTYREGVRIASRMLAVVFIAWAITDTVSVIEQIVNLVSTMRLAYFLPSDTSAAAHYYSRQWGAWFTGMLLRVMLWLIAAIWFYRCGQRVQKFFGCEMEQETTHNEIGQ